MHRMKLLVAHPLVAVLLFLVAPYGFYHWSQTALVRQGAGGSNSETWNASGAAPIDELNTSSTIVDAPGVRPQEYRAADSEGLHDSAPVIGVIVNGKPRAYLANALCSLKECVVNDVVAGQPISVVYAYEFGVPRVFTSREESTEGEASKPLALGIHGIKDRDLWLMFQGRVFSYAGYSRELMDYPFAHCSWAVWKQAFPDTDVYAGELPWGNE